MEEGEIKIGQNVKKRMKRKIFSKKIRDSAINLLSLIGKH